MKRAACAVALAATLAACARVPASTQEDPATAQGDRAGARTGPSVPFVLRQAWNRYCWTGMPADLDALAGTDAVDCGFLGFDVSEGLKADAHACARAAERGARPFRFGYAGMGDSMYCDIAVRTPQGALLSVFYDNDVTGQFGRESGHESLQVRRCGRLRFARGTVAHNSYFNLDGCAAAQDLEKLLLDRHAH